MAEHIRSKTYDEFHARYKKRVLSFVSKRFGSSEAEDITQETMVRAWLHFTEIDNADPVPWLCTVARRIAIDLYHKRERVGQLCGDEDLLDAASPPEPDWPIQAALLWDSRWRTIKALRALKPKERELLLAHDFFDVPGPALARKHGVTDATMRQRVLRARKKFQRAYQRLGGAFPLTFTALPRSGPAADRPSTAGPPPFQPHVARHKRTTWPDSWSARLTSAMAR